MKIFETINYYENDEEFIYKVRKSTQDHAIGIRCNLCKFHSNQLEVMTQKILSNIWSVSQNIPILLDVPYPYNKNRIRSFNFDGQIIQGDRYILSYFDEALNSNAKVICMENAFFPSSEMIGKFLYYADGEGAFKIYKVNNNSIEIIAQNNFCIGVTKSININLIRCQIEHILPVINMSHEKNVSFMLSFVENKQDILNMKKYTNNCLISKIETLASVSNINDISKVSNGLLVARGDLGVADYVNFCSNTIKIAKAAKKRKIELLFATDILLSMNENFIPNRSDLVDITTMLALGCDSIILKDGVQCINRIKKLVNNIEKKEAEEVAWRL